MAKELPFFKFNPAEWLQGDITLHDYSVQGVFSNIMALYWQRDCVMTLALLKQRLSNGCEQIKSLIETGVILHEKESDKINIKFLDEQLIELSQLRSKRVKAGHAGVQAKVKQRLSKVLNQRSSNKIKNKIKNKILNISFSESEIFDKVKFSKAFNWPQDKLKYYWEAADRYSGEGNKYVDWKKAISGWASKDELSGKIKFSNTKVTHTSQPVN